MTEEMAFEVLGVLDGARGAISEKELMDDLDIDSDGLNRGLSELSSFGYDIRREDGDLSIKDRTDLLLPYELQRKLKTRFIGSEIHHFETTPSTIGEARMLLEGSDPTSLNGVIIVAEQQTGGVGRMGREWESPPGGIWATVILRPHIPVEKLFLITMAGSLAIVRAIRRELDICALIKWPNDIHIGTKKVAGLLQEISADNDRVEHALLGFGIDANIDLDALPDELQDIVTSLQFESGARIDRAALFARVLREFELRLMQIEAGEYDTIIREWRSLSLTLKRRVQVKTVRRVYEGEAIDIDQNGALIIRTDSGKVEKVIAGDLFQI